MGNFDQRFSNFIVSGPLYTLQKYQGLQKAFIYVDYIYQLIIPGIKTGNFKNSYSFEKDNNSLHVKVNDISLIKNNHNFQPPQKKNQ